MWNKPCWIQRQRTQEPQTIDPALKSIKSIFIFNCNLAEGTACPLSTHKFPGQTVLQGPHGMAGGNQEGPACGGLPSEGLWVETGKWEEPSLDSGLKNKERGKKKKTPEVNTLGLQWAYLLGHWVLVTSEGRETSISLLQKTQPVLPTHLKFFPWWSIPLLYESMRRTKIGRMTEVISG